VLHYLKVEHPTSQTFSFIIEQHHHPAMSDAAGDDAILCKKRKKAEEEVSHLLGHTGEVSVSTKGRCPCQGHKWKDEYLKTLHGGG
jgi:hypothetical protein